MWRGAGFPPDRESHGKTTRTYRCRRRDRAGHGVARIPQKMSREWVDAFADVPLFAGLSRRHLTKVARLASTKRYPSGAAIVETGATGEAFFVILDGRQAWVREPAGATLGANESFGEMSLLDGQPRSATITARSEVLVMMVPRQKFLKLLEKKPKIAMAVFCPRCVAGCACSRPAGV